MVLLRRCTGVDPWLIFALGPIFLTRDVSRHSWLRRLVTTILKPPDKSQLHTIYQNSASYFLGDPNNDSLQRIYGVSFPSKKQLDEYKEFLAEAAKRDHRKIGREQELFFFNDLSPGSCFFLPHGARIYNTLIELMRVGSSAFPLF